VGDRVKTEHRGPFRTTLKRYPGKGGWTYISVPKKLTPPITRAWARTPVQAKVDGVAWETSVWRAKTGEGFLPVPKRIRGDKGEGDRVVVEFTFVDD
jgi:uncharacterized protein DUF1905